MHKDTLWLNILHFLKEKYANHFVFMKKLYTFAA